MVMNKKYTGIVVSTTHWDRAWYWTFQQFRIRLVQLIDDLIEILSTNPAFTSFTLDGQTAPLEDYLEIKPERRRELERLIRERRLIIGPWYVLPDPFLVSGEALIRNLMLGHKIGEQFGGVMKEGYVPDPFSQIDQMPQILQGFNLCSFLFMRGMGKEFDDIGAEFLWEAPDGSRIFTIYLKEGYFNAGGLGFAVPFADHRGEKPDFDLAVETMRKAAEALKPHSKTGYLLFFNGTDHASAQPELPEMLSYMNQRLPHVHFQQGTISDYVDAALKGHLGLKIHKGEFTGYIHHMIGRSVYSARMYLKQANYQVQTMLEKYAEPFTAYAWLEGKRDYAPFVWQAWKLLLQNHPHDDICGTSTDGVHQDMVSRFKQSLEIGMYVKDKAFVEFAQNINTGAKPGKPIVVYNPLNWERTEVVRMEILFEPGDPLAWSFGVVDADGNNVPYDVLRRKDSYSVELLDCKHYDGVEIQFLARIPGCGYATYYVVPKQNKGRKGILRRRSRPIRATKRSLANEFFRVTVKSNGSLRILDKITKKVYDGCNLLEDMEDDGDEYTYSYIEKSKTFTSQRALVRTFLVSKGSLSATLRVDVRFRIPASLHESRKKRSEKRATCPITSYITLYAGVARIDIRTELENKAKDHRLRVWFPTGFVTDKNCADGHFDVMERQNYFPEKPIERGKSEYYCTNHQGHFVSVSDGEHGLTIAIRGLPEYEIVNSKGTATIALTLLRCIGWLNKSNLMTRDRMAGPDIATPDAQCLGKHTFEYSIVPHRGSWKESKVYKNAHNFSTPVVGYDVKKAGGTLPDILSLVVLEPDELVLSAVKKSEDGNGLIVRFYNIMDYEVKGKLCAYKKFRAASWVNLNEEMVQALPIDEDGSLHLIVGKHKIVTVRLVF